MVMMLIIYTIGEILYGLILDLTLLMGLKKLTLAHITLLTVILMTYKIKPKETLKK